MDKVIYKGFLVIYQNGKDRYIKCDKIDRGEIQGFYRAIDYITALESKLEEARYSATDYAMKLGRANEKLAEAREVIGNILNITYDSEGVAGYHDNGDVALWEEFEEIQQLEEQLKEQGKNE